MSEWRLGEFNSEDSQLGGEFALVWRDGEAQLIETATATSRELDHGIPNVESLCRHIANKFVSNNGSFLNDHEIEDLILFLISNVWMEAHRLYDPIKGASLFTFTYGRLGLRCNDWMRKRFGDERRLEGDLKKRGLNAVEIKMAVVHFRTKPSLDVESKDMYKALHSDDPSLLLLVEEGQKAQDELAAIMSDEDFEDDVESVEAAERALGINASLLSQEALNTLINIALPIANNESIVQVLEANGITRRYLEVAMDDLRHELEAQNARIA